MPFASESQRRAVMAKLRRMAPADIKRSFESGRAEAEKRFGAETRPFDRAIAFVAKALKDAGVEDADFMDVGNRWHNPLASASDDMTPEQIIDMIERTGRMEKTSDGKIKALDERYGDYRINDAIASRTWFWRWNRATEAIDRAARYDSKEIRYAWETPPQQTEVDRQTDIYVKENNPSVRRGTKKWKELVEAARPTVATQVRQMTLMDAKRELARFKNWVDNEARKEAKELFEMANRSERMALELEALAPGSQAAKDRSEYATEVRARAQKYIGDLDHDVKNAEAAVAKLEGVS